MEKVLLFFSGNLDSTLCAYKLAMQGYNVNLVTFDNSCELSLNTIHKRALALEEYFANVNKGKIVNLGIFSTYSILRDLKYLNCNAKISELLASYGDFNVNQLNCLNCRSSMYMMGLLLAQELGIRKIAEGARKGSIHASEQEKILLLYKKLLNDFNIDFLLPIYNYRRDDSVESELLRVSNKLYENIYDEETFERNCVLGEKDNKVLTLEETMAYYLYLEEVIIPIIKEQVVSYPRKNIKELLIKHEYDSVRFV